MELLISQLVRRLDNNAISTAKPMFSASTNPTELLRIISTKPEMENPRWWPLTFNGSLGCNLHPLTVSVVNNTLILTFQ